MNNSTLNKTLELMELQAKQFDEIQRSYWDAYVKAKEDGNAVAMANSKRDHEYYRGKADALRAVLATARGSLKQGSDRRLDRAINAFSSAAPTRPDECLIQH